MKRKPSLPLEDHLPILNEMVEVGTDDFFYTRLKARMEREAGGREWAFPFKPGWVIGALVLLLVVNCFTIFNEYNTANEEVGNSSAIESFAASYDQTINSSIQ